MTEEYEQVKADVEAGASSKGEQPSNRAIESGEGDGNQKHGADAMSVKTLEEARYKIDFLSGKCIEATGELEDLRIQLREASKDSKAQLEEMKRLMEEYKQKFTDERNRRWNLEDDKEHLIEALNLFSEAVSN